jgi:hypothetical protein
MTLFADLWLVKARNTSCDQPYMQADIVVAP